jgi:hypothetical protein
MRILKFVSEGGLHCLAANRRRNKSSKNLAHGWFIVTPPTNPLRFLPLIPDCFVLGSRLLAISIAGPVRT